MQRTTSDDESDEEATTVAPSPVSQAVGDSDFFVFVNDLTFNTSEEELSNFFSGCGTIRRIRWQQSNHGKAFVQFSSESEQHAAVAMSGQTGPGDRPVRVLDHHFAHWYNPTAVSVDAEEQYKDAVSAAVKQFGEIQEVQCHGKNMLIVFFYRGRSRCLHCCRTHRYRWIQHKSHSSLLTLLLWSREMGTKRRWWWRSWRRSWWQQLWRQPSWGRL